MKQEVYISSTESIWRVLERETEGTQDTKRKKEYTPHAQDTHRKSERVVHIKSERVQRERERLESERESEGIHRLEVRHEDTQKERLRG
jgi:hypothetical protein